MLLTVHRGACENLVAMAAASEAYGLVDRTVVGVDECVAQAPLVAALRNLVRDGTVVMSRAFWQELRVTASGETINVGGGSPVGVHDGFDWGCRKRGDSWSDGRVVQFAMAHLYSHRRVVLLSADRRGNREGLKTILNLDIQPVLNRDLSHRLSLVLLLQLPRTRVAGYAQRVEQYLRHASFEPGFHQQVV